MTDTTMAEQPEIAALKTELKWCIENGNYGPRTGAVLAEALEFVESVEREKGEGNQ